jgi:hypothetical protein
MNSKDYTEFEQNFQREGITVHRRRIKKEDKRVKENTEV